LFTSGDIREDDIQVMAVRKCTKLEEWLKLPGANGSCEGMELSNSFSGVPSFD
jgi:hypothetical protein